MSPLLFLRLRLHPSCSAPLLRFIGGIGSLGLLVLSSCALQSEQSVPVKINEAALPKFDSPSQQTVSPEESLEEPSSANSPQGARGLSFRTPDLTETLPSERDLTALPKTSPVIDDSVEENTTIRAVD